MTKPEAQTTKKKSIPYDEMTEDEQEEFRKRAQRMVKCQTRFKCDEEDEDV